MKNKGFIYALSVTYVGMMTEALLENLGTGFGSFPLPVIIGVLVFSLVAAAYIGSKVID